MGGLDGRAFRECLPVRFLSRGGAALLALAGAALAAGPAAAAPTLTGLSVNPGFFTPNGDGITDTVSLTFTPGGDSASVNVEVLIFEVAGGTQFGTLLADSAVTAGEAMELVWSPGVIADGDYRFDVRVTEAADSVVQSAMVTADTVVPSVTLGTLSSPFDPTAPAPQSTLSVPITVVGADAVTTVRILLDGASVDSLGTFAGAGMFTFTWDGNTQAGAAAGSDTYEVLAVARDAAANADSARQDVVLDRSAPQFASAGPDTIQTDTFPVLLSGTATDTDRVDAVAFSVDAGSTYVAVDTQSAPGPSVTWSTAVNVASPVSQRYPVTVRATDRVGHHGEKHFVIAYDPVLPAVTSTVVNSGVAHDGEYVEVRTDWNLPGLTVTMDFKPIDFGYSAGKETVVEDSPGSYLVRYRITPSNTRATGSYALEIKATTGVTVARDTVNVQLVATSLRESEIIAISANRFDPDAGETVTFAGDRSTAPLRVEIYTLSGQPVRVLEGNGFLEWTGTTESGRTVASGVYFLRVQSEGAEELRKVAVLRGGGS